MLNKMYVIYDRPRDVAGAFFVAREWFIVKERLEPVPGEISAFGDTLDEVRQALPAGLVCLKRDPQDDPVIVEVWV